MFRWCIPFGWKGNSSYSINLTISSPFFLVVLVDTTTLWISFSSFLLKSFCQGLQPGDAFTCKADLVFNHLLHFHSTTPQSPTPTQTHSAVLLSNICHKRPQHKQCSNGSTAKCYGQSLVVLYTCCKVWSPPQDLNIKGKESLKNSDNKLFSRVELQSINS